MAYVARGRFRSAGLVPLPAHFASKQPGRRERPVGMLGSWCYPRRLFRGNDRMATVTKKELIDRIADGESCKRSLVKRVIQTFLDNIVEELANGNRLEFRDFGVFESKVRASRQAQNPKTLDKVRVPSRRTVKFKVGRSMKERLHAAPVTIDEATGLAIESSATVPRKTKTHQGDGAASPRRE